MDRMVGEERGSGHRATDKERGDTGWPVRTGATPGSEDRGGARRHGQGSRHGQGRG